MKSNENKPWPEIGGIPIFPFKPDSIQMSTFRIFEQGDIPNAEALLKLMELLYWEPECEFRYLYRDGTPMDSPLAAAIQKRDVLVKKSEWRFFRHPKFKKDYVKIPKTENYQFDWEREVVEKGPEFVEAILELSPRKRTEMDTISKVQIEEQYREHLKRQKYSFDVFLSYSERDRDCASILHEKVVTSGGKIFMAPKELNPGDDFAEEIRKALVCSRELWLVVSPNSIKSEWVISEWGAAWALEKAIVPILYHCDHGLLPDRLKKIQCVDMHLIDSLITRRFQSKEKGR